MNKKRYAPLLIHCLLLLAISMLILSCSSSVILAKEHIPKQNKDGGYAPEEDIKSVYALIKNGKYDEAIEQAIDLNNKMPEDIETYILLANAYFNKSRKSVVTVDTEYLEDTQGKRDTYDIDRDNLGKVFGEDATYDLKLMNEAIDTLEKGLVIAPDRSDVYYGICYMAQESGLHDKLIQTIKLALKQFDASKDSKDTIIEYGMNYFEKKQYRAAMDIYSALIDADPDYEEAVCNYGMMLVLTGDFDEGIIQLKKAILLDPKDAFALGDLALAYTLTGDYQSAAKTSDDLINAPNPRFSDYFTRAAIYMNVDKEKAINCWNDFFALEKSNSGDEEVFTAAKILIKMLNGEAVADYKLASALQALASLQADVSILAVSDYLLEEKQGWPPARFAKAGVYDGLDLDSLAADEMKALIMTYDAAPADYPALSRDMIAHNLCRAYYKQGLYNKAIEISEQIKDQKTYAYSLGLIYEAAGNIDKAFDYFSISAKNDNDTYSKEAKAELKNVVFKDFPTIK